MEVQNRRKKMSVKPTNANIINAVVKTLPSSYQDRIPTATQTNLEAVYDAIWNYQPARNEFINSLFGLIGMQTIDATDFRNPLSELKKNPMRYGDTDEEIFVNMVRGQGIDGYADASKALGFYESYVMANFHNVNFEQQYPITVRYSQLKSAFLSEYGLRNLITAKFKSAISAGEWDEYLAMLNLLMIGYKKKALPATTVSAVRDKTTAEDLMVEMQAFVESCQFPDTTLNPAGAQSTASPQSLITFVTPKAKALMGVKALANAYNLEYADFKTRLKVVNKFDDNGNIQAIVCDARFFRCRDHFREIDYNRNGAAMSVNYFYNLSEVISASMFYPVMIFTTEPMEIASITGTNITDAIPGTERQLNFAVVTSGPQYNPNIMDFEITTKVVGKGEGDPGTYLVPGTQTLVISPRETNFPITVKATSRYRPSVTKTITVAKAAD